jgi:NAD-dependent SIR2 family protein deacetylase
MATAIEDTTAADFFIIIGHDINTEPAAEPHNYVKFQHLIYNYYYIIISPKHSTSLGSGSHSPFSVHVDM